jgi:hypothetical protein
MYLQTYGGSALLHLLAAHPKIIAAFGIAATVAMLIAPQGPGRYVGTATHLARLESALAGQAQVSEARQREAQLGASAMLEAEREHEIVEAIEYTLGRCGSGCTDLSTRRVARDPILLRRVLVLYELDRAATRRDAAVGAAGGRD